MFSLKTLIATSHKAPTLTRYYWWQQPASLPHQPAWFLSYLAKHKTRISNHRWSLSHRGYSFSKNVEEELLHQLVIAPRRSNLNTGRALMVIVSRKWEKYMQYVRGESSIAAFIQIYTRRCRIYNETVMCLRSPMKTLFCPGTWQTKPHVRFTLTLLPYGQFWENVSTILVQWFFVKTCPVTLGPKPQMMKTNSTYHLLCYL